ncbi:MFS transporter [Acinetobacter rudis]|uniref:MFS transporter n=1 Tax=Acinetobacter rudis TaxID=632955 RepID=UPI00333E8274
MLNHYIQLFKAPGSLAFTLSAFIARLALPMIGIGIITLLAQLDYGYARAGIISAVFVLSYALISPQVSRLVDQRGQGKVVLFSALICIIGLCGLSISAYLYWPFWSLVLFAILAGFIPSMSAMVRARWSALYRDQPQLRTAYSFESVLDELTFIIGPPLSVGIGVLYTPASLMTAALLLGIGVTCFILEKTTQPELTKTANFTGESAQHHSVIALPNVQLLAACMIALGFMVGIIDVASVAFAEQQNSPLSASLVLSAYALSSCLAGLAFGAIAFKRSLQTLLLWSSLGTAIMSLGFLWVSHVYMLSVVVALLGIFFAPTMITLMSILEQQVAAQKLTEALTWLLAALNIGVAVGAASTGQLIEYYHSAWAGLSIAIPSALLVLIISIFVYRRTQQSPASQ